MESWIDRLGMCNEWEYPEVPISYFFHAAESSLWQEIRQCDPPEGKRKAQAREKINEGWSWRKGGKIIIHLEPRVVYHFIHWENWGVQKAIVMLKLVKDIKIKCQAESNAPVQLPVTQHTSSPASLPCDTIVGRLPSRRCFWQITCATL